MAPALHAEEQFILGQAHGPELNVRTGQRRHTQQRTV